ncbi:phosphoribosylformylglycinamidine synthase subunit PurQ [Sulfoacidibacillus thermotolerans]|uniref:Phosphoribosylformylglycinamidine synthase subunit PurQ n=1 Tax=Sulfoacidibacillus thermotolerans TaxID=1765684 RepID=A0A2U3D8Q5_SULT2|nr:phosphoribosylformylglycinamidine synthase subunit PurQ [Sulfoacidibacillus thermotolerans]PWI57658.1 phosphoribosylformylglycinamidine synthase I [Sulfoacidibacillus thermotolerans]
MKCAVIQFPGSNCDFDAVKAIEATIAQPVDLVWHTATDLSQYDFIVVPGGFSYGDYLRAGAIARFAAVMKEVERAAADGRFVLGICNGFQVLTEAGLLPGALRRNESLQFRCELTELVVANAATAFTRHYQEGERIVIPIAHGEGNYYADEQTLRRLQTNGQIVFRYAQGCNPNGSIDDIAGIVNERGNVLGMMPHPERAIHSRLGSEDGTKVFTSILQVWRETHAAIQS